MVAGSFVINICINEIVFKMKLAKKIDNRLKMECKNFKLNRTILQECWN